MNCLVPGGGQEDVRKSPSCIHINFTYRVSAVLVGRFKGRFAKLDRLRWRAGAGVAARWRGVLRQEVATFIGMEKCAGGCVRDVVEFEFVAIFFNGGFGNEIVGKFDDFRTNTIGVVCV